jgi:hypothetical protein
MHNVYMPECDQIAMKVMSGFCIHEPRFVESEHIVLPKDLVERTIGYLIPNYGKYIAQLTTVSPKKQVCGRTFLYDIIPYLGTTILQCGFFFMFDYPDHPINNVFRMIHGYQRLATPYIQYVRQLKIRHTEEKIRHLNDTVADVLCLNLEEIVSLRSTIVDYQNHFEQHVNRTAQALITYDATAGKLGRKHDKLLKTINHHEQKICELQCFMFRVEENNQQRHKEMLEFFISRAGNDSNERHFNSHCVSHQQDLEVDKVFVNDTIRLPEPTLQGNIEDGSPQRHQAPSVFASLLDHEPTISEMAISGNKKNIPKQRRVFTRDNEIIRQAQLEFRKGPNVLVNNESQP